MPSSPKSPAHVFGRTRPSQGGTQLRLHTTPPRDTHYRPFSEGPGKPPYQLDIKSILPAGSYSAIARKKKLTFHFNGDMGGIQYAVPQELVAKGMEADFHPGSDPSENPAFLYIVGDCVYFNGEVKEYYKQFYQPYEFYPGPIFAVPGNHDGENLPDDDTLKGFTRNFCAKRPVKMPESGDSLRTAMVQPSVYWTLLTPVASFVGLYTNVPAGGEVRQSQTAWLVAQLKTLPQDRPLIVTMHHPIYSADDYHSGSTIMKNMLEGAVKSAGGRHPEMVVAGHVHDYQRLTKNMPNGVQVPYLVTGAGGYHNLHQVMKVNGQHLVPPVVFNDKDGDPVTLERYSDDRFGFLRMEITNRLITGRYYTVPRPQEPYSKGSQLFDYFEFDWRKKRWIPNAF
ncbi:MAG TPA: metallophosphoesterase [Methylomirabilota bacterium]|nr:metallophosphoesterase [Methylomirabilota bacterium]